MDMKWEGSGIRRHRKAELYRRPEGRRGRIGQKACDAEGGGG